MNFVFFLHIVEAIPPPRPGERWVYNPENYERDYYIPERPVPLPMLPPGSGPGPVIMPRF